MKMARSLTTVKHKMPGEKQEAFVSCFRILAYCKMTI